MKLTLLSSSNDLHHVACAGDVTQEDVGLDVNPLTHVIGPDCYAGKVLVNMANTTYIDSAGISWLVISQKSFSEHGGKLVIHSVPPMVEHVFRFLKMPTILNLAANEEAALKLAY